MEKTERSPPDVENTSVDEEAPRSGSQVPGQILKHANDADEAMKAFAGTEGERLVIDEATNKRLLRRIDLNLMPVRHRLFTDGHVQTSDKPCRSCA